VVQDIIGALLTNCAAVRAQQKTLLYRQIGCRLRLRYCFRQSSVDNHLTANYTASATRN
jgi:hypothetical protein